MGVDGHPRCCLGRPVEPRRLGQAHLDPALESPGQIPDCQSGGVGIGQPTSRKCQARDVLQTLGKYPGPQVFDSFRGVPGEAKLERLVYPAVGVIERDFKGMDCRAERHG